MYPVPSGEDWDLTYRISENHRIVFVPEAIVGHYHPDKFIPYMKNQERRGFDRVKIYKDFPGKKEGGCLYSLVCKVPGACRRRINSLADFHISFFPVFPGNSSDNNFIFIIYFFAVVSLLF